MYIKKLIKFKLNRSFLQLWTGNIIVILNLFFKDILVSVNFVHVNVLQEEAEFLSSLGSHRRSNTHSKASSGSESDGGSHIMSRVSGKRERKRFQSELNGSSHFMSRVSGEKRLRFQSESNRSERKRGRERFV